MSGGVLTLLAFAAAVGTLFLGHLLRTLRWRVMLDFAGIHVTNLRPLASLCSGYVVNAIVPFRLGEIVRGLLLANAAKADLMSVFATIVFERALDLLMVALLCLVLLRGPDGWSLVIVQAVFGILAFGLAVAMRRSGVGRVVVFRLASVFNNDVQRSLLHFVDIFAELWFARSTMGNLRFWALTAAMWAMYLCSLLLFALAAGSTFIGEFVNIYAAPLSGSAFNWAWGEAQNIPLLVYLTLPLVLTLIYAALAGFNVVSRLRRAFDWATDVESFAGPVSAHRAGQFSSADAYGAFLERRFTSSGGMLLAFEERGLGAATLHRIFQGGSGAITALIELDGKLRVRKFATGAIAGKLTTQRDWIADHSAQLPMVEVLSHIEAGSDRTYDMAYIGGTRDLYEAIHTEPVAASAALLGEVIERVDAFHRETQFGNADEALVRRYVEEKVCNNLRIIERALPEFFAAPFDLNGQMFSTTELAALREPDWLVRKFAARRQATIHGDLTIENIMVMPPGAAQPWFLIDPNSENLFASPLIDFAKLLQSLHLGYEALNRNPRHSFAEGRFAVTIHRSTQYSALFDQMLDLLRQRYGEAELEQMFLHEIVHYCRLIPHQLTRSRGAAATFFGCLCLLVRDHRERYPGGMQ